MSTSLIIGIALLIWSLPTLAFAIYRHDKGQMFRASEVTGIAMLIVTMGFVPQ